MIRKLDVVSVKGEQTFFNEGLLQGGEGGGTPYISSTGMCHPSGYGFF